MREAYRFTRIYLVNPVVFLSGKRALCTLLTGCATPTTMAFSKEEEKQTPTSKPVFLMTETIRITKGKIGTKSKEIEMVNSCANKDFEQMKSEYKLMKDSLDSYRRLGGVVPPNMSIAFSALDQAFRAGENFDSAFKSACLEMGNFLLTNEEYCARFSGFKDKSDLDKNAGARWQDVDNYDICMAKNYYRQTQAEAVKKVLNLGDPKSFISVFTQGTKKQIWDLITKWLGDRFKGSARQP
jgi:hypothetical protein